jgi:DNA-directed RNA polymerase subunit alpha
METIAKPNKIEFLKGASANEATVVVEPFYPGYGMTVGNSLRRVMLSSLVGTAVVGVKIEGVSHEFSSLPHVKEDVLEIIMNIKKLKAKIDGEDEEIKLELEVRGKKEVTAADIKKDSRVEIVNKDIVIANITDMAGFLKMEITIGRGRGYRPVEATEKKNKEIGYIETDAIFSPVLAAGLKIETVRVGKMTNWDKLMIDIITDGTITPEKAYRDSVNILQDQIASLSGEISVKEEAAAEVKEEVSASDEDDEEDVKEVKKEKKAKKEKKVK